jgi:hypothetical protein
MDKDGVFWMNSVKIDRNSFSKIISEVKDPKDLKKTYAIRITIFRIERFYYLGMSLGKVVDAGNGINAIQLLGQLMEEFELYIEKPAIENSAISRHIISSHI